MARKVTALEVYNQLPDEMLVKQTQEDKRTTLRKITYELKNSGFVGITAGAIGSYIVGRSRGDNHSTALEGSAVGAGIGYLFESLYDEIKSHL